VGIDERELLEAVEGHLRVVLSRVVNVAELMARQARRKGVKLRVSYESAPSLSFPFAPPQPSVTASVTLYLLESSLPPAETARYVRARVRALERFLNHLREQLEKEGIHCEVRLGEAVYEEGASPRLPRYVTLSATFSVRGVDAERVLGDPQVRRRVLYGSYKWVGHTPVSLIKSLEAEADLEGAGEGERAAEGGEQGEGELEGVEVKDGWIRLIDAVVAFDVPFAALDSLIKQGKLEARRIPELDGSAYTYVKLEDVKRLAEWYKKPPR